MTDNTAITFVVAVNDRDLFNANFAASPCFDSCCDHEILIQENFLSASLAYNDAIRRANNDLLVFAHQDVLLPACWLDDLRRVLAYLQQTDPEWGVLGCSGTTNDGRLYGQVYTSGQGIVSAPRELLAARVQTLDELILILRRSSGLRFDDNLPHFHLYGADICLRAAREGLHCYAINAFCVHNTQQLLVLPREFYHCCRYLREVWKRVLPIQTTCIRITASNMPIHVRRLREIYLRHVRRTLLGAHRAEDIGALLGAVKYDSDARSR